MRSVSSSASSIGLAVFLLSISPSATDTLPVIHQQRYSMGTMFDVVAYHPSRTGAEIAVQRAVDEIVRLDDLMSHYKAGSGLSTLNRDARSGPVTVDPALYDVIQQADSLSRRSGGTFDITIAPLLKVWKAAAAEGRDPSAAELAGARRCVGFEQIELLASSRIRFRSPCVELDLGGIGKGYAVDRAIGILRAAGIQHAMINAGGSSIAAIGTLPGRSGWPVLVGGPHADRKILMLHGSSVSTSQQNPLYGPGEIIDPHRGSPSPHRMAASVVAPSATLSDALSTTLSMMAVDEAAALLAQFPGVSAVWFTSAGEVHAVYGHPKFEGPISYWSGACYSGTRSGGLQPCPESRHP